MMTIKAGEGQPRNLEMASDENGVVAQPFYQLYARDFRGIDGNAPWISGHGVDLLDGSIYLQLFARLVSPYFHLREPGPSFRTRFQYASSPRSMTGNVRKIIFKSSKSDQFSM